MNYQIIIGGSEAGIEHGLSSTGFLGGIRYILFENHQVVISLTKRITVFI
ncbi:Uncharacterized protein dnm_082890 [Desulfonema magnum]|uniref:Uncharacterized protein n=1 Tax=Desulfonema magnum TaxID=45655 RepID=A0A975BV63_9BACT|nr:Uncharacterized protein dnm_082890 [Desulfonema magnum]